MADVLRDGPATIIAIGPLTDVGCLAMNEPRLASKIAGIATIMGRAKNESFVLNGKSGLSDFNFVMDAAAAQYLLGSTTIPMTFLPFNLTRQVLVASEDVAKLAHGSPLDRFLYEGTNTWMDQPAPRGARVCTQYAPGGEAAYRKAIFAFSGR